VVAVDALTLEAHEGELLAVVGPSGCGKTTLLRLLAGLEVPDAGAITLGGEPLFSKARRILIPPHRRRVGMVFQNYALWPHMNVFENVAYPLRVQRLSKGEIQKEVTGVLSQVRLEGLEKRRPDQLSGGQQQRVALARALVMRPRVLLLDEPLSNLDAHLREDMRFEIKRIQRETGVTIVHVTHDQAEAMAIADRIAVMKRGRLVQTGPPRELYEHPRTEFVASFIGMTNLLPCRVVESGGGQTVILPNGAAVGAVDLDGVSDGTAMLSVRPEDIVLNHHAGGVQGKIEEVVYLGNVVYYTLSGAGVDLRVQALPGEPFEAGERVRFRIRRATAINGR
jgi:iron(III) transport system ATP-binding protein